MDFTLDDEQRALQGAVREMAGRLVPQAISGEAPVGPQPLDAKAWQAVAQMGLLGLPFGEDLGGMGAGPTEVVLAAAELGAARLAVPYADALAAAAMLVASEDGAAHSLLSEVIDGSAVVLTALAELGLAWDPEHPCATAARDGDTWKVTGTKIGTADLTGAAAVVTTAQCPESGVCVFLVREPDVDGSVAQLREADAVCLGGIDVLERGLNLGIVALAGEAVGAMDAALGLTVEYLKTRKQFGVPLATFQTLTQRSADMYVSVELARSTALFAGMVLADEPDNTAMASRTKVLIGRTGRHVGQEAVQLHGGIGMTAEYTVGHHLSRLTAIEHTFGDTRHHLGRLAAGLADHEMVDVLG